MPSASQSELSAKFKGYDFSVKLNGKYTFDGSISARGIIATKPMPGWVVQKLFPSLPPNIRKQLERGGGGAGFIVKWDPQGNRSIAWVGGASFTRCAALWGDCGPAPLWGDDGPAALQGDCGPAALWRDHGWR
jgi:hypothetical protein